MSRRFPINPRHPPNPRQNSRALLEKIYNRLFDRFGPQHWWPGETPFEVIVGAILTQNTNWGNVKKAIANLKNAGVLTPQALQKIPAEKLAELIKPSGYFNVKAKRLKNFLRFFFEKYDGDLEKMRGEPLISLRPKMLAVNGVGPETVDSILLYALDKKVFVVDAYTKRFLYRHNLAGPNAEYHDIQKLFLDNLPPQRQLFNEYHALIVRLGKEYCKPTPSCAQCPLKDVSYDLSKRCGVCARSFLQHESRVEIQKRSGPSTYRCHDCRPKVN